MEKTPQHKVIVSDRARQMPLESVFGVGRGVFAE